MAYAELVAFGNVGPKKYHVSSLVSSPSYSFFSVVGYFESFFKAYSGMTPTEYINARRMFYIKGLLHDKKLTLEEIAEKVGYCDSGYLCRIFKKKTGMT